MKKERRYHAKKITPEIVDSLVYDDTQMNQFLTIIEQNILDEVKKRNLSIRALGDMSNIHYSHLSNVFNGKTHIGFTAFIKICIALNIPPHSLFPVDLNMRQTNGERFEQIVRPMDLASVNFLLNFCIDFKRERDRIIKNSEQYK